MYIHVHESMYKYKHVCTMFSSICTDLPYPVQVVRIPDDAKYAKYAKFAIMQIICKICIMFYM